MSEVERHMYCENCDSSCRLIYDSEDNAYEPEICPFCGENIGTMVDEFDEEFLDEEDLLDGLDE